MRRSLTLLMVLALIAVFANNACAEEADSPVDGGVSFPFRLFLKVAKEKPKDNVLISPMSVSTALSMTYPGAAGDTKKALAQVLNFPQSADDETINQQNKDVLDSLRQPGGDTKLEIANGLFGEKQITFKQPFLDANKKYFDSEVRSLDFKDQESLKIINSWVSEKTHGKIPSILDQIGQDAILYLINAIYFKGTWQNKFDKSVTHEADFNTANGGTKKVQMMHMSRHDFKYLENDQFQAVNLPYADGRLSMFVFLPKEDSSLASFESNLNQSSWDQWVARFRKRDGQLGLPRFKVEDSMQLKNPLSEIGLEVAFDKSKADFSGMAETEQKIYISKVIHKTFMEVNEEGTEAAAVTAVEMSVTSAAFNPVPPFQMIVDRPFFVALHDNETGKILFAGHIANP